MKAFSSAISVTLHVAVGAAVFFGTAKTVRSGPARPDSIRIIFPPETPTTAGSGLGGPPLPGPIELPTLDLRSIAVAAPIPKSLLPRRGFSPVISPSTGSGSSPSIGGSGMLTGENADVLSGPLPVYPDLLRQAGVQGRVVLEAVVDTTGRVLASSILVVSATNPGFVASARQALRATLFRPAMVDGKPIRMRVRIPYEFAIRNGAGQAR
jgi:periplasmic protein TonB